MWIQTALSSLLLVALHADLECKGIEFSGSYSTMPAQPMDVCTSITATANGDTTGTSMAYHCDGSDAVLATYDVPNCAGSPKATQQLSATYSSSFTAYCDKPTCDVVTWGLVTVADCEEATVPTAVAETGYIADHCYGTMKYTCSGDNVILKTYGAIGCTGDSTDVSYDGTGDLNCDATGGIVSSSMTITCGAASFTGSAANALYPVYGMMWGLVVCVYLSL
eukprot:251074_1